MSTKHKNKDVLLLMTAFADFRRCRFFRYHFLFLDPRESPAGICEDIDIDVFEFLFGLNLNLK